MSETTGWGLPMRTLSQTMSLLLVLSWFSIPNLLAQGKTPERLILKVDETVHGPFGGQKSCSCLRVYSSGRAVYARWGNSPIAIIDDETKKLSRPEHTLSVEYQMDDTDSWELSNFVDSRAVKRLPEKFGPPHRPIDYFETVSVEVLRSNGETKKISTREYYVADMEEKSRYPSALIILMDTINKVEDSASDKGKPKPIPADCDLKQMSGK